MNWGVDLVRWVFSNLDSMLFSLLGWVYEVFFAVSTAQFFSNQTINDVFKRVQLIVGVFMVFKLSISIIQAIINPDTLSDKNKGSTAFIKRAITCLIMLTLLVPINITNSSPNEYEKQINNNGLLFGTLYSLQSRILKTNTLGRLILGDTSSTQSQLQVGNSNDQQANNMKEIGKEFKNTLIRGFAKLRDCASNDMRNIANSDNPDQLFKYDNITDTCNNGSNSDDPGKDYTVKYYPLLGGIVALVFAAILILFSVDIAVRAIKIAILKLLAPIPIISYMDPNQEKNGAFGNWIKILTSTYLDLFIRLAVVYFVLFLISDIEQHGIVINFETSGMTSVLAFVIICIGLFFFAKQAPKFIKDALGVKGMMQNIGLSSILGGAAMAAGGGGLTGFGLGAMNAANAQVEGANQGKPVPLGSAWSQNRDLMAKIRTGDKDKQGGLWGGAQDYLNYKTRERAANRLGLSKENQALADYNKDRAAEESAKAQQKLENARERARAMQATDQGIKLSRYRNDDGSWKNEDAKEIAYRRYGEQAVDSQVAWDDYQSAYAQAAEAEATAAKAAGNADSIDKARNQLGVSPAISDKYKATYRSGKNFERNPSENTYGYTTSAKPFDPMKGSPDTRLSDDQVIYGRGDGSVPGGPGGHGGPPGGPPPH